MTTKSNTDFEESIDKDRDPELSLKNVRDIIQEEFDQAVWRAAESVLSAHATLLLGNRQRCFGLILEGPSGAGKTTTLRLIKELDEVYRSDDATPASFVSHDASKGGEKLQEIDLLPRIRHKTLLNMDMGSWFSGPPEAVRERWSIMAKLMDGSGYQTDSGAHGQRGYTGDFRFVCLGATTPMNQQAWRSMGHLGQRFLVHEVPSKTAKQDVKNDVFGKNEYETKVITCIEAVKDFMELRWTEFNGYRGVSWPSDFKEEIQDTLVYFGNLIRYARAPISESGTPQREDARRVTTALKDLSQGRALLDGRTTVTEEDIQVCARVALSTMPQQRRGIIRILVDPSIECDLRSKDVAESIGVSRPTAHKRMDEIAKLGIADVYESENNRGTKHIRLKSELLWPAEAIEFPDF